MFLEFGGYDRSDIFIRKSKAQVCITRRRISNHLSTDFEQETSYSKSCAAMYVMMLPPVHLGAINVKDCLTATTIGFRLTMQCRNKAIDPV